MPRQSNPLVLVHGAWHDGYAWSETIRHLHAAGITEVWAPTLLGHGPHTPRAVTHTQIAEHLAAWIEFHDLAEAILVGHSFGGSVITQVTELIPERIARDVYVSAIIPLHGRSLMDDLDPQNPQCIGETTVDWFELYRPEDNTLVMTWDVWRRFISDADEPLARAAFAHLCPEGAIAQSERFDLHRFYGQLTIPQSVVILEDDLLMPWDTYAARLPRVTRRVRTRGSHQLMNSAPERLADAIALAAFGEHTALPEADRATASA